MQFSRMGFGPHRTNQAQELGTDLYVDIRDGDGVAEGVLLGVQVKSSVHVGQCFSSPVERDGEFIGWRFRGKADDFKLWLEHQVPYVLVLYRFETEEAWWVAVTEDRVQFTGKTAIIVVPASQPLDESAFGPVREFARTSGVRGRLEGTRWRGLPAVPGEDLLRTALVAPRLVAPHLNNLPPEVSPAQAMGLLLLGQGDQLRPLPVVERSRVPEDPQASPDWRWRLYAAAQQYLASDDPDVFTHVVAEAADPVDRAAGVAMWCAALQLAGRPEDSASAVTNALDRSGLEFAPLDRGWLLLHAAWAALEKDDNQGAMSYIVQARDVTHFTNGTPSAAALRSAAADLAFDLDPWNPARFEQYVTDTDVAADWWREQDLGWGAVNALRGDFEQMTDGRSDGYHRAWTKMRPTGLVAALAAHRGDAQRATRLLAQVQALGAGRDVRVLTDALTMLRVCGDEKNTTALAHHLRRHGPVETLETAVAALDLARSTRSSAEADLRLIAAAGSVLSPATAARQATALLARLDTVHQKEDTQADLGRTLRVIEALDTLCTALPQEELRAVMDHLADLPPVQEYSVADAYAGVVGSIPDHAWSPEVLRRLAARTGDAQPLQDALTKVTAGHDPDRRRGLLPRISAGDLAALVAWGPLPDLPLETARAVAGHLSTRVRDQIDQAPGYSHSQVPPVSALAQLSLAIPEAADWDLITRALQRGAGQPNGLEYSLRYITHDITRVPIGHLHALSAGAKALLAYESPWGSTPGGVQGAALELLDLLDDQGAITPVNMAQLLTSDGLGRAAVAVLGRRRRPSDLVALGVAATSEDPDQQSHVAQALAEWVCAGVCLDQALELLSWLLVRSGTQVAIAAASALPDAAPDAAGATSLASLLETHPSAVVRHAVTQWRSQHAR